MRGRTENILLKGVSPALKRRLREEAERERRSVNQQILIILERELQPLPPLKPVKPFRTKKAFTHAWLMKAMREGRE
jgi:hypothetical protein